MALSSIKNALCIAEESTWSTAPTAFSSYVAIPIIDPTFTPARDHLPIEIQSATFGTKYPGTAGGKGGTLSFRTPVPALTTAASSGQAAVVASWFSWLMKACGCTETLGTGTAIDGALSSTTALDVTAATGIAVGSIVRVGGACRLVTAVDTGATPDDVTVTPALASAPSAATPVYSGASYVATGVNPSASFSLVAKLDGVHYVMSGVNGVVTLPATNAREVVYLEWTLSVNTWTQDVSTFTGTFPALTAPTPIKALGSPVLWGATSTSRAVASIQFDPRRTIQPLATTSDADGRAAWVYTDEAAQAQLVAYRSTDATDALQTDFAADTTRTLLVQLGGTGAAGNNFVVAAEVAQITAYPAEGDLNGIRSLPITIDAKAPSTASMPVYALAIL